MRAFFRFHSSTRVAVKHVMVLVLGSVTLLFLWSFVGGPIASLIVLALLYFHYGGRKSKARGLDKKS